MRTPTPEDYERRDKAFREANEKWDQGDVEYAERIRAFELDPANFTQAMRERRRAVFARLTDAFRRRSR